MTQNPSQGIQSLGYHYFVQVPHDTGGQNSFCTAKTTRGTDRGLDGFPQQHVPTWAMPRKESLIHRHLRLTGPLKNAAVPDISANPRVKSAIPRGWQNGGLRAAGAPPDLETGTKSERGRRGGARGWRFQNPAGGQESSFPCPVLDC